MLRASDGSVEAVEEVTVSAKQPPSQGLYKEITERSDFDDYSGG